MATEDRYIPVTEHGERWAPRTLEEAQRAAKDYPPGFTFADGEPVGGIVHIEHQQREVTDWVVVEP